MSRNKSIFSRIGARFPTFCPLMDPIFLASLIVFCIPALIALTTYPPYYEDESWNYLSAFEALRGNGFSWAAFHEGHAALGTFNTIALLLTWPTPFTTEATVRIVSLLFSISCLAAVFLLARILNFSKAYVAPVVLNLTPLWYLRVRYGRNDCVALAFALWALVAAARTAPLTAGILSGLAVSVHPVFIWVGPVCLILLLNKRPLRDILRYAAGGVLGIAPQLAWVACDFASFRSISARYSYSSSLNHGWAGWLLSLNSEWQRYRAYIAGLAPADLAVQAVVLLILPILAVLCFGRKQRPVIVALAAAPLLSLLLLVSAKLPLYLIYALPTLAVVSAAGANRLPTAAVRVACIAALLWTGIRHVDEGLRASREPTVAERVDLLSARLPAHATVFSPLIYGGLIRRRPDLRFFTYHALSNKPLWGLPPCGRVDHVIQSLINWDPRPVPARFLVNEVYFVTWQDEDFLNYFKSIYTSATAADLGCIVGSAKPLVIRACGADTKHCEETKIVPHRLKSVPEIDEPRASRR
jgi:hypothetical protein